MFAYLSFVVRNFKEVIPPHITYSEPIGSGTETTGERASVGSEKVKALVRGA